MKEKIKICIIGLGYVGLPLARLFATTYPVVGFDINTDRITELKKGKDSTLEVDTETLNRVLVNSISEGNGLYCTSNIQDIENCNYYIVTVPSPVDSNHKPNLIPLINSPFANSIGIPNLV